MNFSTSFVYHQLNKDSDFFDFMKEPKIVIIDPFGSSWMKIVGLICNLLQIPGLFIIACFIYYEISGLAGPHRTIINQLTSSLYFVAFIYFSSVVTIDLVRLLFGPLPSLVCKLNGFVKNGLVFAGFLLTDSIIFIRFVFICVWKSYRPMLDSLLCRFILISSYLLAFLISLAHSCLPNKTSAGEIICAGKYWPDLEAKNTPNSWKDLCAIAVFAIYSFLFTSILVTKFKTKTSMVVPFSVVIHHNSAKDLESLTLNFIVSFIVFTGVLVNIQMNK